MFTSNRSAAILVFLSAMGSLHSQAQLVTVVACSVGGSVNAGGGTCACPIGYSAFPTTPGPNQQCKPDIPNFVGAPPATPVPVTDFYRDSQGYPVCGRNRVPVKLEMMTASNPISTTDVASSFKPRSSSSVTVNLNLSNQYTHNFARPNSLTFVEYLYSGFNRCMCTWKDWPEQPHAVPASLGLNFHSTVPPDSNPRFYKDDIQSINMGMNGYGGYGPVAIYRGPLTGPQPPSGRDGTIYSSNPVVSECGCPNFNERAEPIQSPDGIPTGSKCVPTVLHPSRIAVEYNAQEHSNLIMNSGIEARHPDGNYVSKITLSPNHYTYAATETYNRKIWICDPSSSTNILNVQTGNCEMLNSFHAAGPGDGVTSPASEVSPRVTGMTAVERYNNTVNRKFAACLNGFSTTTDITQNPGPAGVKFDCVANNIVPYNDFNQLWTSTDKIDDGGLPNALVLANSQGRVISGFYTKDGKHCDEYSEFAGTLQPALVNPESITGHTLLAGTGDPNFIQPKGTPIPLPGSESGGVPDGYNVMNDKITQIWGKRVPSTAAEMRKCRNLVRAAVIATCPPPRINSSPTYEETIGGQVVRSQCTAAARIQIHMRIETIYEVAGEPKMPILDTVLQPGQANTVSIQQIFANKNGTRCDPPMHRDMNTGTCTW